MNYLIRGIKNFIFGTDGNPPVAPDPEFHAFGFFVQEVDGKVSLYGSTGALIATYSRARDAKRGAERRGIPVLD